MAKAKHTILVVEDDPLLLDLYRLKLRAEGFAVVTATNGREGVEAALVSKPELILLDILMPEVDGYAALKKLKSDERTKKIPVIIFSNLSQSWEIEKGLKLGADDFVIKTSLTPAQLAEKVKEYF
ncbi:MAG: hypothetical protein A2951_02850 [Candidatus Buchananbacteria bacterium RIFCSPLOWO2_01_FULL_56_15]|uniref:Response regulatory domain-containing protein n=2 Tax=Candidatus Buchananiibacteriota TaxID=1817903 RepID=A0A1G1YFB9_9BACT|nr:MAG: hypothetical protein A3J59_01625 [Candidatus Buchananbacteria bacterium RIFCSPHIGHO2_02_FULL_56_16]OGY54861.1 MAG: hypothetical protein A2951_02850 [Candidatus Buchananbacteria bacterium RIFCSPLOWO2_01_FULL_56_15]